MASNPTFEGEDSYEVIRDGNEKDKSHEYAELPARGRTGGHTAYSKSFIICLLLINLVVLAIGFGIGFGVAYGLFKPEADLDQDVDECASNPCQNGARCSNEVNGYQCICTAGYTGATCTQEDVDGCASNPCQNGARCSNEVNGYQCICTAGYTGATCAQDVDECASSPCQNGARCSNGVNGYQCICTAGYTGATCTQDVDECASNPCATSAACSDGVDGYTCICDGTVTHRDCMDVRTMSSVSGVYTVTPCGGTPTQVYCDMDTSGGGWLVFQKRVDGSVDFYLNWTSYAAGFGDLNGEFWLGNRNLHLLTAQKNYTVRVVLGDWEGNQRYAQYSSFAVGSEQDKFRLTIVGGYTAYSGDADALSYSSGWQFSARDSDSYCAPRYRGAWWYGHCSLCNLNGRYYPAGPYTGAQSQTGWADGVWWKGWKGEWYSLKSTRMMIRPAP